MPHAIQRFDLVAQVGDPRRRLLRGEKLARMRLERHHGRSYRTRFGGRNNLLQQRLVATVHPIKVADGQRAGHSVGWRGNTAKDLHRQLPKSRRDYTKLTRKTLILLALSAPVRR